MTQSLQEIALEAEWLKLKAEVERLNTSLNEESIRANVLERCVEERENEIARLKAELEKRPEVVYCEGCIYKNQCKAAVIFQESTPKMEGPFKFYYLKFCSFGQRKSEEGK